MSASPPLSLERDPLLVFVGSGGVGKTTLAASVGVRSALAGQDTLVMTFDPSLRLKDALGVGEEARDEAVPVDLSELEGSGGAGRLDASLLDARRTFDRLVERYAPDEAARDRILSNRFYQHLAGSLGGILEYMAVERLFEVVEAGGYSQVILDTPPARQALDFLEAPRRIVSFLESGALKIALKPWFDESGRFKAGSRFGFVGRRFERFLDEIVGIDLLRDMAEFFQAFAPLFDGFRERAARVEALLRSEETVFVLVAGPGEERIPDTLFFARKLREAGLHLGPIVVNRVHGEVREAELAAGVEAPGSAPEPSPAAALSASDPCHVGAPALAAWLAARDRAGLAAMRRLLAPEQPLAALPLLPDEPTDLGSLARVGERLMGP